MKLIYFMHKRFLVTILLGFICFGAWNGQYTHAASNSSIKLALYGYDPVAYFTLGQARKGSQEFTYSWQDKNWLFLSADHLTLFKSNPKKYLPQFNGFCANGLSDGHIIEADPQNWRIIDGKLYLFFSRYGREQWSNGVKSLIENAEETFNEQ